jgi:transcriptional regulator with XRE-family HTH domain
MNQYEAARPWFWLSGEDGAGHALAGVRQAAGLTQAQAAALVGMDRTTLLNMEASRNPAIGRLVSLFNRMGYDLIAVPYGAKVSVDTRLDDETTT